MRVLLVLTLLLVSSLSFSADYTFTCRYSGCTTQYSDPKLAAIEGMHKTYDANSTPTSVVCTWKASINRESCIANGTNSYGQAYNNLEELTYRNGTGCSSPKVYDPSTGACITGPTCPAAGTTKVVGISCDCTGTQCIPPESVSFEGCAYTFPLIIDGSGSSYTKDIKNYNDPANSTCIRIASATGEPLLPSEGVEDICPTCIADVPANDATDPTCVSYGAHSFCADPASPNCGTLDGQPYCNMESDACGSVNGVWQCIPESGSRTCSYTDGQYNCVAKNPDGSTSLIPLDSPDHPNNGGNADGNTHNDAQAPGSVVVGGGAQGSDGAATNKAIADLQGAVTDSLGDISELLGDGKATGSSITAPTETGTFDLAEWDQKIADAKTELKTSSQGVGNLLSAANNWIINGGGGSLSCFVEDWGRMCLSDYEDQLIGIRYVLIFMAYVLAVYIIFLKD